MTGPDERTTPLLVDGGQLPTGPPTPDTELADTELAPAPPPMLALSLEPAWNQVIVGWLTQYHEATAVAYRRDLVAWIRFAIAAGLAMETAGPGDIAAWPGRSKRQGLDPRRSPASSRPSPASTVMRSSKTFSPAPRWTGFAARRW